MPTSPTIPIHTTPSSTITPRPLEYLYFHIKKSDQKLYDAFKSLDQNAVQTQTQVNNVVNNASRWFEEVPSGTVDGMNRTFSLSNTPIPGSLTLYLNIVQREGVNFTLSTNIINFLVAPKVRDINPTEGGYFLARYQF